MKLVLFNGFVVAFPMTLLGIYTMKLRGCAFSGDLPTFTRVVVDIIMFSLVEEFGFYYSHRYNKANICNKLRGSHTQKSRAIYTTMLQSQN